MRYKAIRYLTVCTLAIFFCSANPKAVRADEVLIPVIDGDWWQIAGDPDLGPYTRPGQQPVDFGIWQAKDGTWQLWSCIRHTGCGGHTRLFYRWEGRTLTDANWTPIGIAMEGKPELGEGEGGLQAPHVVQHEGQYVMAYGNWFHICFATSQDGKDFQRVLQANGQTGVFTEGIGHNTRDPMLIPIKGLWHCYYTASPHGRGYAYCRTSPDLKTWSPSCVVSYGGEIGPGPWNNECPHVVELRPGLYYFFRNEYYGERARNWVYASDNPLNFGIDDDRKLVRTWRVAAPEIIHHEGQYFIASLMDNLKGIKLARLKWVTVAERGEPIVNFRDRATHRQWKLSDGDLPAVFTNSQRTRFNPPAEYFIGTAETDPGQFDDNLQGVIESPAFTLTQNSCVLYVSGGRNMRDLYIALVAVDSGKQLARVTGTDANEFKKIVVQGDDWIGRQVRIQVVDRAEGSWGHINLGGVYTDPLAEYRD